MSVKIYQIKVFSMLVAYVGTKTRSIISFFKSYFCVRKKKTLPSGQSWPSFELSGQNFPLGHTSPVVPSVGVGVDEPEEQ